MDRLLVFGRNGGGVRWGGGVHSGYSYTKIKQTECCTSTENKLEGKLGTVSL